MIEIGLAQTAVHEATERFVNSIASSSPQWLFRPRPSEWCIAEIVEHVAVSTTNITNLLANRLHASAIQSGSIEILDLEIPYLFYRGDEPPNVAAPTGTWMDQAVAQRAIEEARDSLIAWSSSTKGDLRGYGIRHPVFGMLDGIQWMLFAAAHMERHRAQVIGVQQHTGYPQ